MEAVPFTKKDPDFREAAALLGGASEPEIGISRSADQLRRWRNPLSKAIKNLIAVIGDEPP